MESGRQDLNLRPLAPQAQRPDRHAVSQGALGAIPAILLTPELGHATTPGALPVCSALQNALPAPRALPAPTADLFVTAGAIAAERAAQCGAPRSRVEEILRRAVDQAAALRGEAA